MSKVTRANIELIDDDRIRKLLAKKIIHELDNIDPTDILADFECSDSLSKIIWREKGTVDSNPRIKKLDIQALKLIKMTIRNLRRHVRQYVPLWIINE